ncbi:MAG: RNA-binding S4 domain-containing protein [Clostridia bacterium]|nr:RNA-binding S4 domain-containing protein [Clostridia bacterium]
MREITIKTPFIKLDSLLKFSGLCDSGGIAKAIIQSGEVTVNGEVCLMRGKKIKNGDTVTFNGQTLKINAN